MATIELTAQNFSEIIEKNDTVLIDFWASWCGPCVRFAPTYEKVSEQYPNVTFGKVDTEDQQQLAGMFGIRSIPTIAIFRDQVQLFREAGALPEHGLVSLIDQTLALDMDEVRAKIAEAQQEQQAEA